MWAVGVRVRCSRVRREWVRLRSLLRNQCRQCLWWRWKMKWRWSCDVVTPVTLEALVDVQVLSVNILSESNPHRPSAALWYTIPAACLPYFMLFLWFAAASNAYYLSSGSVTSLATSLLRGWWLRAVGTLWSLESRQLSPLVLGITRNRPVLSNWGDLQSLPALFPLCRAICFRSQRHVRQVQLPLQTFGRFTSSLAATSRQDHYTPESTSQNSGKVTPERPGECQIDMIPLIHGDLDGESDGEKSRPEILTTFLVGAGSSQEGVSKPIHHALSQTNTDPPPVQIAFPTFPMDPEGVSRYMRHSPM